MSLLCLSCFPFSIPNPVPASFSSLFCLPSVAILQLLSLFHNSSHSCSIFLLFLTLLIPLITTVFPFCGSCFCPGPFWVSMSPPGFCWFIFFLSFSFLLYEISPSDSWDSCKNPPWKLFSPGYFLFLINLTLNSFFPYICGAPYDFILSQHWGLADKAKIWT